MATSADDPLISDVAEFLQLEVVFVYPLISVRNLDNPISTANKK